MARRSAFALSELKCHQCGNITQIQRRTAVLKKGGHIKHLYCWRCKRDTRQVELSRIEKY
ncbi:ribosome associated inhibitor A; zinc finger domain [Bacillus phage Bobb]|uniref:Ribosome associated inhibitor A n=1 Tax=Bacillus phage Bobb TaxID=1527469 RepID=A0A076G7A5_9CAUD|nr:ribosome associated inhibitor A; zinc finger domain [Bacillus phage Bobb]AII27991.1 ribosome associated inhibitor A [Bacillus phage Bobb]